MCSENRLQTGKTSINYNDPNWRDPTKENIDKIIITFISWRGSRKRKSSNDDEALAPAIPQLYVVGKIAIN